MLVFLGFLTVGIWVRSSSFSLLFLTFPVCVYMNVCTFIVLSILMECVLLQNLLEGDPGSHWPRPLLAGSCSLLYSVIFH